MKRNFIVIVVVVFILALSANAFGQNNTKSKTSKSKVRPKVNRVNMEDGVFLPGYRTTNKHRKNSSKRKNSPKNFSPPMPDLVVDTQMVGRKKPKNSHNLLPFIEQDNVYRKSKRKRNK